MSNKLSKWTVIGLIVGIIGGIFIPSIMIELGFLGDIYVNLLKILIVPFLFCNIITTVAYDTSDNTSKITIKSIILFIIMFLLSYIINAAFVLLAKPGIGFEVAASEYTGTFASLSLRDFFVSLVPSNIIAAASSNQILPVIIFAFAIGWSIKTHKVASYVPSSFFMGMDEIMRQFLKYIMYLTPIGVFSLIGTTVANYGVGIFKSAIAYVAAAWIGSIIIVLLIMVLPVWLICKYNPIEYIKKISKIWVITLTTCSSAATLPNTIRLCNEELNIPKEVTNITVPLGCTIHMCGGAVSFSLLAIFCCQMYGIHITAGMWLTMIVAALLINMGAPGIPGGGIVLGATYLSLLGIPLDFIGFYAGIYKLLDMVYTTLNVTGDITANCLIKRSLE